MPVKKSEIVGSLTTKAVKKLEDVLDERIKGYNYEPMNIPLREIPRPEVEAELIRLYREAGWELVFENSPEGLYRVVIS